MDNDLKIILYVVIAIIWIVYNNYKKIMEASRKRDLSKPPEEPSSDKRSRVEQPPREMKKPARPSPASRKAVPIPRPSVKPPPSLPKREPMKREKMSTGKATRTYLPAIHEGGEIRPSAMVNFEEAFEQNEYGNSLASQIRNADFRNAIILSEVLHRPYN